MTDLPFTLSAAQFSNLLAIRKAAQNIDATSLRLATGRRVNSALDNPQNFFTGRALNNRANDLSRLLDGIASSLYTIEEAAHGVTSVENLLNIGESYVEQKLEDFRAGNVTPPETVPSVPPLNTQILADSPVAYYQLNETSGTNAANQGSIGTSATYQNGPSLGQGALYTGGGSSVAFNGTNQSVVITNDNAINLTNHALRTVELVFRASSTTGRQVLYEEGGTTNSFTMYIFNGNVYVTGRDSGAWGPANISAPINAGQTYHLAFTFDFPNGVFRGYLDGVEIGNTSVNAIFPAHSGNVSIGSMNNGAWFHDGAQSGNNFYFNGNISDVAIYNSVLSPQDISDRAEAVAGTTTTIETDAEFENILDQIDAQVNDAQYRGINLLKGDNLKTFFNESRTNFLLSDGIDFTSDGLGILHTSFYTEDGLERILDSVRAAIEKVRAYGNSLATDQAIITARQSFTKDTVNVLKTGASSLTHADQNEEGANLLASQTRQQLAIASLAVSTQSSSSVLRLFA